MTASREELLHSICPNMHLDKYFFLRIYGYDITTPGFAESALIRLEIMGCSKARGYYSGIKTENEYEHQKQMKEAAEWYMKRLGGDWKRKEVGKDEAGSGKARYQFAGFPEDW